MCVAKISTVSQFLGLSNNYFYFCAQFVLNVYQTILQPFYKDFMQINQEIQRTWRVLLSWNRRVIETWTFLVGGQGQNCPTQSFIENINLERVQGPNLQISWQLYSHHETRKPVMASSLGILVADLRRADLQLRHEAQHLHRHHQGGHRVWEKSPEKNTSRWARARRPHFGLCTTIPQYLGTQRTGLSSCPLSSTATSPSRFFTVSSLKTFLTSFLGAGR